MLQVSACCPNYKHYFSVSMHHETSCLISLLVMFKVYVIILACFPSTLGDSDTGKTHMSSSVLANIHTTVASDTLSQGCYLALHTEIWKYRVLVSHHTEHKVPS
jgi:hypothetical protein